MTMVVSLITTMVRSKRYLRNERRTDLQQHGLRRIRRWPLCFSKTALLYFNSSMLIMNSDLPVRPDTAGKIGKLRLSPSPKSS